MIGFIAVFLYFHSKLMLVSRIPIIDIHTHNYSPGADIIIYNPAGIEIPDYQNNIDYNFTSVGFHPWHLEERYSKEAWLDFENKSQDKEILALGEAGLDKIRGAEWDLQLEAFQRQIDWAASIDKVLIVHNVRASEEVWHALNKQKGKLRAIMHAFRRNKKVAKRFLDLGHYISIGHPLLFDKNMQEVLNYIPRDRFFLETDGFDGVFIQEMYEKAAEVLKSDIETVSLQLLENFQTLFPESNINYGTS